jgi:hypothetical protein
MLPRESRVSICSAGNFECLTTREICGSEAKLGNAYRALRSGLDIWKDGRIVI